MSEHNGKAADAAAEPGENPLYQQTNGKESQSVKPENGDAKSSKENGNEGDEGAPDIKVEVAEGEELPCEISHGLSSEGVHSCRSMEANTTCELPAARGVWPPPAACATNPVALAGSLHVSRLADLGASAFTLHAQYEALPVCPDDALTVPWLEQSKSSRVHMRLH